MLQWQDREADLRWAELSWSLSNCVNSSNLLHQMERNLSVVLVRADGLDQAKHKVPRALTKTHVFDRLWRPALHCHMVWSHGFGLHFALSDPDTLKSTNNNWECIARMLDSVYHGLQSGFPHHLVILQDNCSRECKNGLILSACTKLVALNVASAVTLAYPLKGHTHSPLDAVGGQAVVKCSGYEFDTAEDLVDIYSKFLSQSITDAGTARSKFAYKCTWFEV